MQEYVFHLRKGINKGLRPTSAAPIGSVMLVEALNLRVTEMGLEQFVSLPTWVTPTNLHTAGITVSGKFPQLLQTNDAVYMFGSGKLWDVTNKTMIAKAVYLPSEPDEEGHVQATHMSGSRRWFFASFDESWVAVNGNNFVFKLPRQRGYPYNLGLQNKIWATATPKISACIAHRGRVIYGGFDRDTTWNARWQSFWGKWTNQHGEGMLFPNGLDGEFIWWTGVGAADMFWFVFFDLAMGGVISADAWHGDPTVASILDDSNTAHPLFFEMLKRGDMGFMPIEHIGTIEALVPLNDNVVAYGTRGISVLKAVTSPFPTYGQSLIGSIGIANEGAVANGHLGNIFVSLDKWLFRLSDRGLERLGYQEFLKDMNVSQITVTYNPTMQEYYIADGGRCFLYNQYGMTEINQIISDVMHRDGITYVLANRS